MGPAQTRVRRRRTEERPGARQIIAGNFIYSNERCAQFMDGRTIFLSYAWSDGTDIAMRLRAELTTRGYQIWRDREQILAGENFTEKICAGIRESRLMVALMTPSSVRLASDAANKTNTDSVCLNEIQEAR